MAVLLKPDLEHDPSAAILFDQQMWCWGNGAGRGNELGLLCGQPGPDRS